MESYEYELPDDFEDEEIEEDEAFNSEDERMYGHLFEDNDQGAGGGWTDDDDEEEYDENSEGPPTDLLDSDEEDINAIFQKTKDGSETSSSSEDEEDDSEEDSDASSDHEQEDDEDEEEGEQRRQDLVESVTGRAQKQAKRLKHKQQVRTEAYPESEYNLPGMCFVISLISLSSFFRDYLYLLGGVLFHA